MSDRSIRETVEFLAGTNREDKVYAIDAIVNEVDLSTRTCTCQCISAKSQNIFPNVRLMVSVDDGFLIVPTVGSNVTIILSTFTDPYVTQYSEIDSIIMRGGDLGGMVITPQLIKRLNNIENLLNDLILKYTTHTHNVTAVGSPTGPSLAPENGSLVLTVRDDIENTAITQG